MTDQEQEKHGNETYRIDVVSGVTVPKECISQNMSDEELRETILREGELTAAHELAISTKMVREEVLDD